MDLNQLPQEILTRIFRMSCFTLRDGHTAICEDARAVRGHCSIPPAGSKLIPPARNLALVCTRWKEMILSDPSLNAIIIYATSFRDASNQLETFASSKSVQLNISDTIAVQLATQDSVEDTASMMEKWLSRIQVLQISALHQSTPEAAFLMLSKFSTPRLNLLKYTHHSYLCAAARAPVLLMGAQYLFEVIFSGVRVEPTHPQSWQGFCQFSASAPNLRRLSLANFHSGYNQSHLTEIVRSAPLSDIEPELVHSLPHLTDLTICGSTFHCVRLLCYLELKMLESLAMPRYDFNYMVEQGTSTIDQTIIAVTLHHVKRLAISEYDLNIKHLLWKVPMPSLKDLEITRLGWNNGLIALPTSLELEHLLLDVSDVTANVVLRLLSSSDQSSRAIRSLTLAVNTEDTARFAFQNVKPALLANIRCLTLFGSHLDGEALDDICLEMPGIEVLRIVSPTRSGASIKERRLEPQLYYDAAKSIRLLTNLRYLGYFLRGDAPAIVTKNCHGVKAFLKQRNRTAGFRRIECLAFNTALTEPLRQSLACLVDRVVDGDDYERDTSAHPWKLYGDLSELARRGPGSS